MSEVLIILVLMLLNGLFSMAEIALVSARKARLEGQAAKGDKDAKRALQLANHPDTFLSTVQIGITLIGILTGIFSGDSFKIPLKTWLEQFSFLAPYSTPLATVTIVVIITFFTLVLGELVPKRLGLSNPEAIAKWAAGPMQWLTTLTYPFIWLLTKCSHLLVKALNIKSSDSQVTEEEIKAIISEGTEQGTIEEAEQEIIERVFHLSDRNIASLMTHRSDIEWIGVEETVGAVKARMDKMIHSVYPVCEEDIDHIKGVVSIKDLFRADPATPVAELMDEAMYVPENITAYQVLEKFKETRIHQCFMVNEYGSMEGMITLNDILEAIVGDLPQEEDIDFEVVERSDGSFLVDAQIPFYEFLDRFDQTDLMDPTATEYNTLAGFIIHQLEKIPKTGEEL
ncbi:MAG: HlyC/CorC family transporter, partial [Sphingobacteriia bacterium]